jgi:predicted short-subunit dehydrogenase-like oxidoreductase (DUF2520 family)
VEKSIAIIGAGRVGTALGKGLHDAGWQIGPVVCRSEAAARNAVRAIGGGKPRVGLTRKVLISEVTLVAVPSAAIAEVSEGLAAIGGEEWRGKAIFHTSETRDRSDLRALERCGGATGSVHPLQVFGRRVIPSLQGICFGIDGSGKALKVARRIVTDLGGIPVKLNRMRPGLYDVALRFATDDVALVIRASAKILASLGFSGRQAANAAKHLALQTLENVEQFGDVRELLLQKKSVEAAVFHEQRSAVTEIPREYADVYEALKTRGLHRRLMDLGRNPWQH